MPGTLAKYLLIFACLLTLSHCALLSYSSENEREEPASIGDSEYRLRQQVVEFAQKHLGTKYKYAGKRPGGFDCSGFTYFVMDQFGVTLSASSKGQSAHGKKVNLEDVNRGDLVFFKRPGQNRIFHVALVIEKGIDGLKVIHSTTSKGVRIDNISTSSYWAPKLYSARDVISK